jgi:activating signal cointegrator 1
MMKAISLWQPWATLIAIGAKRFETRSWATSYIGPLAIHAAKRKVDISELNPAIVRALLNAGFTGTGQLPLGCVVCTARLAACWEVDVAKSTLFFDKIKDTEVYFGDFSPGRYAWRLDSVRLVDNIPAKGSQGFWEWNAEQTAVQL